MNYHTYKAMIEYLEKVWEWNKEEIKFAEDKSGDCFMSAREWSDRLGTTISGMRLKSMYDNGLVVRNKNSKLYGDNAYRYWPVVNV